MIVAISCSDYMRIRKGIKMSVHVHDLHKICFIFDRLKETLVYQLKKKTLYRRSFCDVQKNLVKKNSKYKIHRYFTINY